MIIDRSTDLTQFEGKRVVIDHGRNAQVFAIHHGVEASEHGINALRDGVWGDCWYDRHGDDRGGNSSFWWPYGTDLTVVDA
jgi:hypothetical protein